MLMRRRWPSLAAFGRLGVRFGARLFFAATVLVLGVAAAMREFDDAGALKQRLERGLDYPSVMAGENGFRLLRPVAHRNREVRRHTSRPFS